MTRPSHSYAPGYTHSYSPYAYQGSLCQPLPYQDPEPDELHPEWNRLLAAKVEPWEYEKHTTTLAEELRAQAKTVFYQHHRSFMYFTVDNEGKLRRTICQTLAGHLPMTWEKFDALMERPECDTVFLSWYDGEDVRASVWESKKLRDPQYAAYADLIDWKAGVRGNEAELGLPATFWVQNQNPEFG